MMPSLPIVFPRLAALVVFPLAAAAATPEMKLSVPVLGYVFDPAAQTIREATGVPGAASLDGPTTGSLQSAWVHSPARVAIVVTKDGEFGVLLWAGGARKLIPLTTSLAELKSVSFSASAQAAVLSDGSVTEVWTNLTGDPTRASIYSGATTAAAVRNDGVAFLANEAGEIVSLRAGEVRVIAPGDEWRALALSRDGAVLFAVSATEMVELSEIDGNPGRSSLAAFDSPPSAVQVATDGTRIAVALENDVVVVSRDGAVAALHCGCHATAMTPLAGNLIVSLGEGLVLDADAAEPRIFRLQAVELLQSIGGAQ